MTLDSLRDLDTSGLCLVKTLSTALTCWPYRNTALRDGARTSTRTSSVAKGRTASIHCRPAPPRQTEALSSRTSRSRPWTRRSQAVRERKTSVLGACRVPNPAKRLNVVQRPKAVFEHAHAEGVIGPSQWEPHLYERSSIGPSVDCFWFAFRPGVQ